VATRLLAAELLKIGKYKVNATDISEDMLRTAAKRTYMSDFSGVTLLPG
jgi:ubiquinone/menaquinone biosynthesis C-methylase UbiE